MCELCGKMQTSVEFFPVILANKSQIILFDGINLISFLDLAWQDSQ